MHLFILEISGDNENQETAGIKSSVNINANPIAPANANVNEAVSRAPNNYNANMVEDTDSPNYDVGDVGKTQ